MFKGDGDEIHADAPHGYCFDVDLHSLVCFGWKDTLERIVAYGVQKCEMPECDTCTGHEQRKTPEQYAEWMNWELIYGSPKF